MQKPKLTPIPLVAPCTVAGTRVAVGPDDPIAGLPMEQAVVRWTPLLAIGCVLMPTGSMILA